MSNKNIKALVVGESCRDIFTYGICLRLCPEAPVPVFNPIKTIENGGMAMNVQKNLAALEVSSHIFTNENWRSITKTRFIDQRDNHMFMRLDENDNKYPRADVKKINFEKYDVIIASDYCKGFLSESDLEYISKSHPCTFLDSKKILGSWSENFTFTKINNIEYERTKMQITPSMEQRLIVTLGSSGAQFRGVVYPVNKVDIKDVSGAGDTFIASLALEYVQTKDIEKAIAFANRCATIVVQKKGVSVI